MEIFGHRPDGRAVHRHRLENAAGVAVDILTLGGIIQRFFVPDSVGRLADIALGYADLEPYLTNPSYLGAIVGRCANRIGDGKILIDGTTYLLSRNRGRDTLHGGDQGFHRAIWTVEASGPDHLVLTLDSPDGDQGFPGALNVRARYSLGADNGLRLDFTAKTTRPTVVNLTSHAYWNLAAGGGGVLDHRLRIEADAFTPVGDRLLPTGEILAVAGTPFDFREPTPLRDRVRALDPQIALAGGLDHNFVLRKGAGGELSHAARLSDPGSGRILDVLTTEPGLQVYTGNSLGADGTPGKNGKPYANGDGVALETQHLPDAPRRPAFPSILLRPGETYRSSTVFQAQMASSEEAL